jgi:2-polyprenyl-3-methyl-5-hydroxy-6-metoxy-1,4-benzoquinol methylase
MDNAHLDHEPHQSTPPPSSQAPSPVHLFDTINSYQKTAALKGAIELDVFSSIAAGQNTAAQLAQACRTDERGTRILCDYLVVIGFLTKQERHYGLTPDTAAFLDKRSPAYMGGCIDFMLAPHHLENFKDVAAIVRKGGTTAPEGGNVAPEHPVWVKFARAMKPMMAMPAQLLAKLVNGDSTPYLKVLDIAAGHGLFGIAVAAQNPNAQIVALDWPAVLEVAQENAQEAGIAARFTTIAGDAFAVEFGDKYDVVLLPNFLHHFDAPTCEILLRKVHAALSDGGRAIILEFIPNEDRVSPPMQAAFSLMMLGSTPGGDVYTFAEFEAMCRNAGFVRSEFLALPPTPQQAVIAYKK